MSERGVVYFQGPEHEIYESLYQFLIYQTTIQVNHMSRAVCSVKSNSTRIGDVNMNRVYCRDKYPSTMLLNSIEE